MNEEARGHYYKECSDIIDILNQQISAGQPKLRAPDPKFNRQIGAFSGKTYSVDGQLLSPTEYGEHLKNVLPQPADLEKLRALTKENDWVVTTLDVAR
jgi:hypothetical protein